MYFGFCALYMGRRAPMSKKVENWKNVKIPTFTNYILT